VGGKLSGLRLIFSKGSLKAVGIVKTSAKKA
jgi:hypothetical protein